MDRTVGVNAVDCLDRLFDGFPAMITRVSKVNAPLLIDGEVVRRIERPLLESARKNDTLARLHIGAGNPAPAIIGSLGYDHPPLSVELYAATHSAGRAQDHAAPCLG